MFLIVLNACTLVRRKIFQLQILLSLKNVKTYFLTFMFLFDKLFHIEILI